MVGVVEDPVRTAVVGLGGIGRFHAAAVARRLPEGELRVVVDAIERLARETGTALGSAWSTSYGDVLARPDVDAVVIATPTPHHGYMIEQAAVAGKQVFCEKPIALDLAEADAAVAAVRRAGVVLQVGFHRRFDPDWVTAREWLSAGTLGEPRLLRISHRNREPPHASGNLVRLGDLFVDVTIHDLDAARWLLGDIDTVFALGGSALSDLDGTDLRDAALALRCMNGCLALIDNTREAAYGFECSAEIVGSTGTARVGGNFRLRDAELLTVRGLTLERAADHLDRHARAYDAELQHFLQAVRLGRPVSVSGEDGVAALELAIAARLSAAEGRPIKAQDVRSLADGTARDHFGSTA